MNNKRKTYLLLIIVLSVWGTIAYRISSGLQSPTVNTPKQQGAIVFTPKTTPKLDTFSIKNVKKDPFLGRRTLPKKARNKPIQKTVKTTKDSPIIAYTGVIKAKKVSAQIFVLTINQKQCLLKKGQTIDHVTLVRGNHKSVTIRYNNKLQTIQRQ